MADSEELKFLVEGLSQKGRRRIFLDVLVKIGRNQRDKYEEGKISYSEISPMDKASEQAGVSPKQYRNYLNKEARIPVEPTCNVLANLSDSKQQFLILFDWRDNLFEFKDTFPNNFHPSRKNEEIDIWGVEWGGAELKEREDCFVLDHSTTEFNWIQNHEFTADKSVVRDYLEEKSDKDWEVYKTNLEYVKASLPRLKENQAVIERLTNRMMQQDLNERSPDFRKMPPFIVDQIRHSILKDLAETIDENDQISVEEVIEFLDGYRNLDIEEVDIERFKEICDVKLFDEDLQNKVKLKLDQVAQYRNKD